MEFSGEMFILLIIRLKEIKGNSFQWDGHTAKTQGKYVVKAV